MLGSVAIHAWVESALYVSGKIEVSPDLYRVEIERESKRAPDMRFRLEVPRMGGIDRYAWNPDVVIGQKDESGGSVEMNGNGHVRRLAGSKIKTMLKEFGATTSKRALTVEALIERGAGGVNGSAKTVREQLRKAIDNQLGVSVEKDERGARFWVDLREVEEDS